MVFGTRVLWYLVVGIMVHGLMVFGTRVLGYLVVGNMGRWYLCTVVGIR